mgnify:CR=1 FL=1
MTGEETFSNLHEVLRNLYDEMMPLCSDITGCGYRSGRTGCTVLCGLTGVAGSFESRAD